jgi:hypothetical protein
VSFIKLDEYPLDLIPFDNDLLSLEMGSAFKVQGRLVVGVYFQEYQFILVWIFFSILSNSFV